MLYNKTILTLLIGAITGLLGGATALPAKVILLPLLMIFAIVPNFKTAMGTTLLAITAPITLLGALEFYHRGQVDLYVSFLLAISIIIFGYFGAYLTKYISDNTAELISGFGLIIIGIFFIWNSIY